LALLSVLNVLPDGHYLNLPVVESDGRLVAIVDVLKLTYATLEQVGEVCPYVSLMLTQFLDERYEHGNRW
jgi:hypothetical protein